MQKKSDEKPLRKIPEAFKELTTTFDVGDAVVGAAPFSYACSLGFAFESADMDFVAVKQTVRLLAQNREAARKSRLRKNAYVQQLESSRIKLAQLEQELKRARAQFLHLLYYLSKLY